MFNYKCFVCGSVFVTSRRIDSSDNLCQKCNFKSVTEANSFGSEIEADIMPIEDRYRQLVPLKIVIDKREFIQTVYNKFEGVLDE